MVDFKVLKGFKTEYAIKHFLKFFGAFFQKINGLPLTFFEFFAKKHPNTPTPPRPSVKAKFCTPAVNFH